jgi:hypothetical protein
LPTKNNQPVSPGHWRRLVVLLHHSPISAASLLRCPSPAQPPSTELLEELVRSAEPQGLEFLLAKHLFSTLIHTTPEQNNTLRGYLSGFLRREQVELSGEELLRARWTGMPVLVCRGKNVSTLWFLIGFQPGPQSLHVLLPPFPAPESIKAMHDAMKAAQLADHPPAGAVYCLSLQGAPDSPVTGNSLGLPFSAALCRLAAKQKWPDACYATGALKPDGGIIPVDMVQEKCAAVADRARLFLCPDSARPPSFDPVVACRNLEDACFALHMSDSGGKAGQVDLYRACLKKTATLLKHYDELPSSFFALPRARERLDELSRSPAPILEEMTSALKKIANLPDPGPLTKLLRPDQLADIVEHESDFLFTIFEYVVLMISRANHRGDIAGAQAWFGLAEQLRGRAKWDRTCFSYLNNRVVTERFNRFDFRPGLPPEFISFIEFEERHNAAGRDDYALGAAYGTMAQNFGFCGPAYLDDLERCADQAAVSFGQKYKREKVRPAAYRIYAFLDAGLAEQAAGSVDGYLGLEKTGTNTDRLAAIRSLLRDRENAAAYHGAVALRFLADTWNSGLRPHDITLLNDIAVLTPEYHDHPWQLTALNLGRLYAKANLVDEASRLFRHAETLCRAGNTTMRIMALLPLAELYKLDRAEKKDCLTAENLADSTRGDTLFNRDHFKILHALPDGRSILEQVATSRSDLFPFSYR